MPSHIFFAPAFCTIKGRDPHAGGEPREPAAARVVGGYTRRQLCRAARSRYPVRMTIDAALVPAWFTVACSVLMALSLGLALRFAPWGALLAVPSRLHLMFGALLGCIGLWSLNIRIADTVTIHLLGMTTVTLLLGWCFALICGSLALLAQLLVTQEPLAALPAAWLLTVAAPTTLSAWLVWRLSALRVQNLFIYTLGAGFGGGMLSVLGVALLALPVLWLIGLDDAAAQALAGWPAIALVLFPEGFINGMLVTAACVFFPGAVKTFDEGFYYRDDQDQD